MSTLRDQKFHQYSRHLFIIKYAAHKGDVDTVVKHQHLSSKIKSNLIRDYTRTYFVTWFDINNEIIEKKALKAYARDRGYYEC